LASGVLDLWLMRIAIPQWQGRVSPVFDVAGNLLLIDVDNGEESRREQHRLLGGDPLARVAELLALRPEILICGAISKPVEARLASAGVRVIGFICGPVDEVLGAFLGGELSKQAFIMPGCQGWRRRLGRRNQGPGGSCRCPNCGETVPHLRGQPCNQMVCAKCGTRMTRV